MLPPGNLIVSLYFRSFRIRIPPRPHTARSALRRLRRNKRRGAIMGDEAATEGSGGEAPGPGLSRAVSKRIQFSGSTKIGDPDPETAAMLTEAANGGGGGGGGQGAQDQPSSAPPKRGLNAVESWRANSSIFKDDEESDGDDEFELYDDIYSMMFLCHFLSPASFFSLFTFALKIMFFTFLIYDLLEGNSEDNPFGAPAGISNLVRIAQFFMLPVAVAMQEDLIGSIFLVNVHYDAAVLEAAPGATRNKWIFSSGLRLIDGMYSLIVNFCLLLTSDTVLGLMLNFAALAFLQTVDNVAFHLALNGYLTDSIEEVAHRTTKVTLPKYARGMWAIMDSVVFVAIFIGITVVWVIVTVKQIRGDYLCQSLGAEFGTEMFPNGDAFMGAYDKVGTLTIALRAVYELRRTESSASAARGVFAFCSQRNYWTYVVTEKDPYSLTGDDVCGYTLRSPEAQGNYDITEIPPSDWFYRDHRAAGNDEPVSGFNLWCNACEDAADCSNAGTCSNHQCVCDPGFYGLNCQYGSPARQAGEAGEEGQIASGFESNGGGNDEHIMDPHGREEGDIRRDRVRRRRAA